MGIFKKGKQPTLPKREIIFDTGPDIKKPGMTDAEFNVITVLRSNGGYIGLSAEELGWELEELKIFIAGSINCRNALDLIATTMWDRIERSFTKACIGGERWAVERWLALRGHERGYISQVQHKPKQDRQHIEIRLSQDMLDRRAENERDFANDDLDNLDDSE